MNTFFFSFWFFLPAGIANVAPVFASKLPILREYCYPLDFNKQFLGKRILGDNKTIRGLLSGIIIGIIVCIIQENLYNSSIFIQNLVGHDYMNGHPELLGFLLSFGALAGDSFKSFFKRQINILSGRSWFPFDQMDYILGGIISSIFFIKLPFIIYVTIFIIYFILHLVLSYVGFLFKFKKTPI